MSFYLKKNEKFKNVSVLGRLQSSGPSIVLRTISPSFWATFSVSSSEMAVWLLFNELLDLTHTYYSGTIVSFQRIL